MSKTPEEILIETFPKWSGYITPGEMVKALDAAGFVIVPKEPTEEMIERGRLQMPVEVDYKADAGMLFAEIRPIHECVSPAKPYAAMIAAAQNDESRHPEG